jgi:hypothetical protein
MTQDHEPRIVSLEKDVVGLADDLREVKHKLDAVLAGETKTARLIAYWGSAGIGIITLLVLSAGFLNFKAEESRITAAETYATSTVDREIKNMDAELQNAKDVIARFTNPTIIDSSSIMPISDKVGHIRVTPNINTTFDTASRPVVAVRLQLSMFVDVEGDGIGAYLGEYIKWDPQLGHLLNDEMQNWSMFYEDKKVSIIHGYHYESSFNTWYNRASCQEAHDMLNKISDPKLVMTVTIVPVFEQASKI